VLTCGFALLCTYVLDAEIRWRDVWLGGVVTAVLFTLGKTAIGYDLGQASVGSAYGAAGSMVGLLVWVYYAALLVFCGAAFTQAWATQHGGVVPQPHTVLWCSTPSTAILGGVGLTEPAHLLRRDLRKAASPAGILEQGGVSNTRLSQVKPPRAASASRRSALAAPGRWWRSWEARVAYMSEEHGDGDGENALVLLRRVPSRLPLRPPVPGGWRPVPPTPP
jgi:hypothetical protein